LYVKLANDTALFISGEKISLQRECLSGRPVEELRFLAPLSMDFNS